MIEQDVNERAETTELIEYIENHLIKKNFLLENKLFF